MTHTLSHPPCLPLFGASSALSSSPLCTGTEPAVRWKERSLWNSASDISTVDCRWRAALVCCYLISPGREYVSTFSLRAFGLSFFTSSSLKSLKSSCLLGPSEFRVYLTYIRDCSSFNDSKFTNIQELQLGLLSCLHGASFVVVCANSKTPRDQSRLG